MHRYMYITTDKREKASYLFALCYTVELHNSNSEDTKNMEASFVTFYTTVFPFLKSGRKINKTEREKRDIEGK